MNVVLTPDGPLDAAATLSRYRIWGEDPVNRLRDGVFRRVVRRGNQLVPYEVHWQGSVDDPKLLLRIVGRRAAGVTDAVLSEVRQLFGLDFDLPGFYRLAKAVAIRGVARALLDGGIDHAALVTADNAEIIARLTALRGIGRWTADWYMARCLGRGDVCPAGDLAVRKAFHHYYGRGRTFKEEAIRRRAAAWGPYQTLAVHYLLAGMRLSKPTVGGGT